MRDAPALSSPSMCDGGVLINPRLIPLQRTRTSHHFGHLKTKHVICHSQLHLCKSAAHAAVAESRLLPALGDMFCAFLHSVIRSTAATSCNVVMLIFCLFEVNYRQRRTNVMNLERAPHGMSPVDSSNPYTIRRRDSKSVSQYRSPASFPKAVSTSTLQG